MQGPAWQPGHGVLYRTIPAFSCSIAISLVILPLKFRTTSIDRPEGSLDRDMVICTCLPQRGIGFAGHPWPWPLSIEVCGLDRPLSYWSMQRKPCCAGQNSCSPQLDTLNSTDPSTLVSFKSFDLLHSLTSYSPHIATYLAEHLLHYHGPTIISYGAATPLSDLHCSDLGYCDPYAPWHA